MARNYEVQIISLREQEPDTFWLNPDEKEAVARERDRTQLGLQRAMWDLSIELLGHPMEWESLNATRSNASEAALLRLALGFLDRETTTRLVAQLGFHRHQVETIENLAEGILLDEDTVQIAAIHESFKREAGALLGPEFQEEMLLRFFVVNNSGELAHANHGFVVSGSRFRTVTQISSAPHDLWNGLFPNDQEQDPGPEMLQAVEIELARQLGEELYADWARAKNPRFRRIYELGRENNLTKPDSIQIFNAVDTAETHVKEIHADPDLTPEEVLLLLAAVQSRALATFKKAVDDKVKPEIRQQLGSQLFDHLLTIPGLKEEKSE
jgi:hypothetical protein